MRITLDFKEKTIEVEEEVILDTLMLELRKLNINFAEWSIKGKNSFFINSSTGTLWGGTSTATLR